MHTHDNVLQALHDLELKNPKVLLNISENNTEGKGKIPKDHIPCSPDTTKYPHNNTSNNCLLRCEQDGENLDKILYDKSRVHIKTHDQNHHCFYQAVPTSLHQYIKHLEGFNKYTTVHLKYQMLLHLLSNIQNTKLMKKIFGHAWFEIIFLRTCPKAWILKFLQTKQWWDAKSMLGLITHVENKNHTDQVPGV